MSMNTRQLSGAIDRRLTTIAIAYSMAELVGYKLFPRQNLGPGSHKYPVFDDDFMVADVPIRPLGVDYELSQLKFSTEDINFTNKGLSAYYAKEAPELAKISGVLGLQSRVVRNAMSKILLSIEVDQASLARKTTTYNTSNRVTLTGADKFTDATSDVIGVFNDAVEAVSNVGKTPNICIMHRKTFNAIRIHPQARDYYKNSDGQLSLQQVSELVGIPIFIGDATTKKSATSSKVSVWGNDIVMAYAPQGQSYEEPSFGYTFQNGNPKVAPFEKTGKNGFTGFVAPIDLGSKVHVTMKDAGYLIQGAI